MKQFILTENSMTAFLCFNQKKKKKKKKALALTFIYVHQQIPLDYIKNFILFTFLVSNQGRDLISINTNCNNKNTLFLDKKSLKINFKQKVI